MIHSPPSSRLLIIGLDGGVWSILGSLADLGEMPNLARLRSQGIWSDLISTQPPFTAPAWSTFATGVNPGRHGVLNFIHKTARTPAESLRNIGVPVNSSHIHAPTFWDYLQAENKRIGYINVPLSYPLRPVGDFAISGMLTPPDAGQWTHPADLAQELGDYIIDLDYGRPGLPLRPEDFPNPSAMLDQIMQMGNAKGDIIGRIAGQA
jgi:predicted AlkP superfamily phosphohydrolase/phosphomutase